MGSDFHIKPALANALDTPPRSDDVVASMAMPAFTQPMSDTFSQTPAHTPYSHLTRTSTAFTPQRPPHSTHPSFHSESPEFESRYGNGQMDLTTGLDKFHLNENGVPAQQRPPYLAHASSYDASLNRLKYQQGIHDLNYQPVAGYPTEASNPDMQFGYNPINPRLGPGHGSITPSEYPRMDSPFYPIVDNPAVQTRNGNRLLESQAAAAALERKLRGFQQEQEYSVPSGANSLPRVPFPPTYDLAGYQTARLNALAGYYPVARLGGLGPTSLVGRPHRDHDPAQVIRSPLLEEFRANSKGNRRYELKVCGEIFITNAIRDVANLSFFFLFARTFTTT